MAVLLIHLRDVFFWKWGIVWQVHPSLTSLGNVTRDGIQDTKSPPATSDAELTTTLPMVFRVHPRKKPQNCSMDLYHNVWKLKLQLFLVFCFVFWWVCDKLRLQNYPSHRARDLSIPKNDNLLRYAGMHLWNLIVEERPVLLQNTHYNVESWIVNVHSTYQPELSLHR